MSETERWQVPFCPDCGQAGRHAKSCACFPGDPVVHGNFEWVVKRDEVEAETERLRAQVRILEDYARETTDKLLTHITHTREQWCPVCRTYHVNVGEKTDAGRLTRPCPRLAADDPRNQTERNR